MKAVRWFSAVILSALAAPAAPSQEPPKPGPEHDVLKKMVGDWDLTMKAGGVEFKGAVTYKMDLGGLWLVSSLECDLGGMKFSGRGMDSYDAGKKKYVSVWIDSMGTQPLLMEGEYDKAKKTLTMVGTGPGPDGKPTKFRTVTETPDENTINFSMHMGDGADPAFTIVYKRKK
jgi:hypothetical protein